MPATALRSRSTSLTTSGSDMSTADFPGVRWRGRWVAPDAPEFVIDPTSVGSDLPPAEFSRAQFRRVFDIEDVPPRVPLRLSADSRYVLWVNGAEVGRGPIDHRGRRRQRRPEYRAGPRAAHRRCLGAVPDPRRGQPSALAVLGNHGARRRHHDLRHRHRAHHSVQPDLVVAAHPWTWPLLTAGNFDRGRRRHTDSRATAACSGASRPAINPWATGRRSRSSSVPNHDPPQRA